MTDLLQLKTIATSDDLEELLDLFAIDQNESSEIVVLDARGRAWIIVVTENDDFCAWGAWWEDDGEHTARNLDQIELPLTVLSPRMPDEDDRMPPADALASIWLYHPQELTLVSDGHGDFPDAYELTPAGRNLIINTIENRT